MTFTEWLSEQLGRDDPIAELAEDAAQDLRWPAEGSLPVYRRYLHEKGVPDYVLETFQSAWDEYEASGA